MASELVRSASVAPDVLRAFLPQPQAPRAWLPEPQASPEQRARQLLEKSMSLQEEKAW
jgi:hypothetical protein